MTSLRRPMGIMHDHDDTDHDHAFQYNHEGLTSAAAAEALQKWGRNELPEKD